MIFGDAASREVLSEQSSAVDAKYLPVVPWRRISKPWCPSCAAREALQSRICTFWLRSRCVIGRNGAEPSLWRRTTGAVFEGSGRHASQRVNCIPPGTRPMRGTVERAKLPISRGFETSQAGWRKSVTPRAAISPADEGASCV